MWILFLYLFTVTNVTICSDIVNGKNAFKYLKISVLEVNCLKMFKLNRVVFMQEFPLDLTSN